MHGIRGIHRAISSRQGWQIVCGQTVSRAPIFPSTRHNSFGNRRDLLMALMAATLYAEELKATTRGRFALLGAAVILLAVGTLATVGTQDTWLDGYGMI